MVKPIEWECPRCGMVWDSEGRKCPICGEPIQTNELKCGTPYVDWQLVLDYFMKDKKESWN